MQTIAALFLSLVVLLALADPASAGRRPSTHVTADPGGVHVGVSTPASPGTSGPGGDAHAASGGSDHTSVSCSFAPAQGGPGLTLTASCMDPTAPTVPLNLNVRFVVPVPATAPNRPQAGGAQPIVTPAVLARQATRFLPLPAPAIHTNPSGDQLVFLETWLWVDSTSWGRRTATASVPGLSVTVVATPASVTWRPGDGTVRVCHGPGSAYDRDRAPSAQHPTCAHTYRRSSLGEPAGRYRMTATITWNVAWTSSGAIATSGALPPITRTAQTTLRVVEAQTLN